MIKNCAYCKEEFDGHPLALYCPHPKPCASRAKWERIRADPVKMEQVRKQNAEHTARRRAGKHFEPFTRACEICGNKFLIDNALATGQLVCGDVCRQEKENLKNADPHWRARHRAEQARSRIKLAATKPRSIACDAPELSMIVIGKPEPLSVPTKKDGTAKRSGGNQNPIPASEYASKKSKPGAGVAHVKPNRKHVDALTEACDKIVCLAWLNGDKYERSTIEHNNPQIMFVEVMG